MDDIYRTNICGVDIDRAFSQQAPGGRDDWNFARTGRDGKPVPHRGGGVRLETSDPVHKAALIAGLTLCDELASAQQQIDDLKRENAILKQNRK